MKKTQQVPKETLEAVERAECEKTWIYYAAPTSFPEENIHSPQANNLTFVSMQSNVTYKKNVRYINMCHMCDLKNTELDRKNNILQTLFLEQWFSALKCCDPVS